MNKNIEETEKYKEDSNEMYRVIRQLQAKDQNKILVHEENGITASEKSKKKL